MQASEYTEKYKSIFLNAELDSVLSSGLKTPNLHFISDKYSAIRESQVKSRSNLFREALNAAIANDDVSQLQSFVAELHEICIRNSDVSKTTINDSDIILPPTLALKTLMESYISIIKFKMIYKPRVILDVLNELVRIPNTWCVQKCVECYVMCINTFDDLRAEKEANEFYSCVAQIAPEDAWVRFRRFRLDLGCRRNCDFTKLDNENYKKSREGASIFADADAQLKELFKQQAAAFTQRKNIEEQEQQAIEKAENERKRKEEEARNAKIEHEQWEYQYRISRRQARADRAKAGIQWCAFLLPASLLIIAMIAAFIKPSLMFGFIHFGWVIGIYIAVPVIIGFISIKCYSNCGILFYEGKRLAWVIVINSICLIFMIIRLVSIPLGTIKINSAFDFNAISNMPIAKTLVLNKDVDFKGGELHPIKELPSGCTFDGGGHIIKNFVCKKGYDMSKGDYGNGGGNTTWVTSGLVAVCKGTIKNIVLQNGKFNIVFNNKSGRSYSNFCLGNICGILFGGELNNCKAIDCKFDLSGVTNFRSKNTSAICGMDFVWKKGKITNCEVENCETI